MMLSPLLILAFSLFLPTSPTTEINASRLWQQDAKHTYSYGYYGYGYGYGYGYYGPPVSINLPNHLKVRNQYYNVSVNGLVRLCLEQNDLCNEPLQMQQLEALQKRSNLATSLGISSIVVGLGIPLLATPLLFSEQSNAVFVPLILSSLLGALGLGIASACIAPQISDIMGFVNGVNAKHHDQSIELQLGLLGRKQPSVLLGYHF